MVPFADAPDVDLTGKQVVIANGRRDPMANPHLTQLLAAQLGERGAQTVEIPHSGGHTIDPDSVTRIAELLAERR